MLLLILIPVLGIIVMFGVIVLAVSYSRRKTPEPVLDVQAVVLSKEIEDYFITVNDIMVPIEDHYIAFRVKSGDSLKFYVDEQSYNQLHEGDWGELRFQGKKYIGFARM